MINIKNIGNNLIELEFIGNYATSVNSLEKINNTMYFPIIKNATYAFISEVYENKVKSIYSCNICFPKNLLADVYTLFATNNITPLSLRVFSRITGNFITTLATGTKECLTFNLNNFYQSYSPDDYFYAVVFENMTLELPVEFSLIASTQNKQDNLQFNAELFGYNGVFDEYLGNGKVLKRWEKTEILSENILSDGELTNYYRFKYALTNYIGDSSGILLGEEGRNIPQINSYQLDSLHYYLSSALGSAVIFLEKSKIDAMTGSTVLEKAQNYIDTYKHVLVYQLATPTIEDVEVTDNLGTLTEEDNYFVYNSLSEYKFLANGINNTYSLPTTDTNYDVYVSGKLITEDITKGATSVTFSLPPRNGKVIKIVYNKENTLNCYATAELLEPVGSPETFDYFSNLSVTEVVAENNRATKSGLVKNTVKNKHYEINITVDMFDDVQQFVEKWQNKKFQLTIQHGDRSEVFAPCEIIDNVTDDYWNSEATTIRILAQSKYWVS